MIVKRYFSWHGSRAGFIIASLGALVIPAHFIVERASRVYSERRIMKYSILCKCRSNSLQRLAESSEFNHAAAILFAS